MLQYLAIFSVTIIAGRCGTHYHSKGLCYPIYRNVGVLGTVVRGTVVRATDVRSMWQSCVEIENVYFEGLI